MGKKRYGNELHPVYVRWLSITQRCNNPKCGNYRNYGARGILLAEDLRAFVDFCTYVEALPDYDPVNRSLDRIDNHKGYEKGNLRWVLQSVQIANQRFSGKGTNTYTGVGWSKTHQRWVARVTYEGKTLFARTYRSEEDALTARNIFIQRNNLPHTIQSIK